MKKQRLVALTAIAMRIAFIQIFLVSFLTSMAYDHHADAQGVMDKVVTLSVDKGQLKDVFNSLKTQTGARFVFSSKTIEANRKVSIKARDKKLSDVLEELLAPFGINYKMVKDRIVLYRPKSLSAAFGGMAEDEDLLVNIVSADKEVKGQVTDDKGSPLPGVSVVVKGTTKGVNTDATGSFTIKVPDDQSILVVSYIGYQQQEVDIAGKTSVTIAMIPTSGQLSDVVVVGYGTQKKVTVTGAVTQVKGSELAKSPTVNLSNALAGRLPGVTAIQSTGEPGYDGSTIRIRGSNTPNNSGALIVIDGVPDRAGGLERLNPSDIETMSVLKDAAAAIYGSRGGNGVILITTKRGKSGKPLLSYDFNQGWSQATRIPKMADAVEYATIVNELTLFDAQLPSNQWKAAWTAFQQTGTYTRPDNGNKITAAYAPDIIQKHRDGTDPWGYPNTDWFGTALKKWSPQSKHNLQLSGGSETVKYLASIGYNNQDGYYKNSATGYKQYDMRFNLDAKVNKYINTSLGITAREESRFFPTKGAGAIFRMLMRGKPTEQEVWPNGLPGPDIENGENPIVITTNATGYDKDTRDYFQTNGRVELQVPGVKGLKLTGFASLDKYIRRTKRWETPWYLYFWDKKTYEADGVTPLLTKSIRSTFADPRLTESHEDQLNVNLTGFVNYDLSFGSHTINAMAAVTRETITNSNFNAFRRNYISPAIDQLFAGGDPQKDNNGGAFKRARLSYFGRVNYNYQEKYMLEFLWRYDGSYMFPKNDRFGFFPGVLVGWRLSEENFMKPLSFIDNLKLRGSYGQMGNDNILFNGVLQEYRYLSTYGFNTYVAGGNVVKTLTESGVPNPGYTWEVANNANVGLEGAVLQNKLSFELDYFYNIRSKILMANEAQVPASAGMDLPPQNLGKVKNKGWEFSLTWSDKIGRDFKYSVNVNGGYAKNEVVKLPETPGLKPHQLSQGHTFGTNGVALLVYEYDGVFLDQAEIDKNTIDYSAATNQLRPGDMKLRDVDGNGKIDGDDRVRMDKNRDPLFTGGVNINLQYKGFDCTLLFQAATGGLLFIGTESGTIGNYLQYSYDHRWTVDNPSSVDPRLSNRGNTYYSSGSFGTNTYWVRSSNYLRMKNLEFGYNFSNTLVQKAGMSGLRLYVNGINLFTVDKMKIWDPESTSGNGQYYPQARILNVGARVTF
ncbi:SusC/RagA family TonB-linked outer membrane protein [Paraflavitalea soli]|uniref:SusC/RagA family TonB-linked outer membrane protein n=1 Tax=Paraflavitalea soli TaxID=2315862 RepID=A0A3B7MWR1_9BACT|nr:TonB-dependent receptor [Paraflavitalea soli]AXY77649.1 SusC/RagA family TonB-linked outer membrane protein [Paraflavitalea soli]